MMDVLGLSNVEKIKDKGWQYLTNFFKSDKTHRGHLRPNSSSSLQKQKKRLIKLHTFVFEGKLIPLPIPFCFQY